MIQNVTTLERAFELARSGTCERMGDLVRQLHAEGYNGRALVGITLRRQLMNLMRKARDGQGS